MPFFEVKVTYGTVYRIEAEDENEARRVVENGVCQDMALIYDLETESVEVTAAEEDS